MSAPVMFPSPEELLPHAPPMRLIDAVVAELDDGVVCRTTIAPSFLFLRDGEAEMAVCIELVAQAVGCCVGLSDRRDGLPPRAGFLVGCRDARLAAGKVRVGDELLIHVRRQWVEAPLASFTGEVKRTRDDLVLATVELTVYSGPLGAGMER